MGTTGPTGATGATGPGADGYLRVSGTASGSNETSPKTVTASCPAGKVALGGGFLVTVASGVLAEITVTESRATADNVWTVTGSEDNDSNVGNWSIQAFVVCANLSA